MPEKLIEFKNISKSFGPRQILDQINLEIFDNQTTTIIGKSGSGKSVLLKHIIGLLNPDAGEIFFRGRSLAAMDRREWDAYRSQISFCFQNNALFDSLTVFENVALPLRKTTRLSRREIDRKVTARLAQMELAEVPDKYPADLSGGMQKRVALARALITDPKIVLFDEPTTGQDPIRKNAILSMIAQYQRKFGFTTIMISHELPDVFYISDRILVLYDQQIVFQGDYPALQALDHPFVDEFINSLEEVQNELPGLYFQQKDETTDEPTEGEVVEQGFAVILFVIERLTDYAEIYGPEAAHTILETMESRINSHFSSKGISNRSGPDRFVSILPTHRVTEAEIFLNDFAAELKDQSLGPKQARVEQAGGVTRSHDDGDSFVLEIMAGIASGNPAEDIGETSQKAWAQRRVVAQFFYDNSGVTQSHDGGVI